MLRLVVLTLLVGIVKVQGSCNNTNYIQWNSKSDCYRVREAFYSNQLLTWDEAQASCAQEQATLATISNAEIQEFINVLLYSQSGKGGSSDFNAWIGLNDNDADGDFEWINGETYDGNIFQHWAPGEPKGLAVGTETCVQILSDPFSPGLWKTVDCKSTTNIYVCQMDAELDSTVDPMRNRCPKTTDSDYLFYLGFCFKVIKKDLIFGLSKLQCSNTDGASLAFVGSGYYNSYVKLLMMRSDLESAWIGLQTSQDVYASVDGNPVRFINWGPNEPSISSTQEACVAVNRGTGYWSPENCNLAKPAICTIRLDAATDPSKDGECWEGWQKKDDGCYIYVSQAMEFEDAQNECRQRYALSYVYVPHASFDFNLNDVSVGDLSDIWIGVKRDEDKKFRAVDISPLDSVQWASGQPADIADDEDCMVITPTSRDNVTWSGRKCDDKYQFFCRHPLITGEITTGECPDGWYKSDYFCYQRFNEKVTFDGALERCKAKAIGGNLAAPTSDKLSALMTYLMRSGSTSDVWIGARDINDERKFKWTTGKSVNFYTNWAPGQPDGYLDYFNDSPIKDDCVKISADPDTLGLWDDVSCSKTNKLAYICESYLDPNLIPPTPPPNDCLDRYGDADSCYVLIDELMTFDEAKAECERNQSSLVSISNGHENGLLQYLLGKRGYVSTAWIGLNDQDNIGEYTWDNGWPVSGESYLNWGANAPTGGKCTALTTSQRWQESNCNEKFKAICKKNANVPDPPQPGNTWCDEGWERDLTRSSCYLINTYTQPNEVSTMFINYADAKRFCKKQGATLPSLHSIREQVWFYDKARVTLGRRKIWLGMHRTADELFRWDDGSAVNYVNWASKEPNGASEGADCVTMYADNGSNHEWSDSDCFERHAVVCKKPGNQGVKSYCQKGWTMLRGKGVTKCFYFSPADERRSWEDAQSFCNLMEAELTILPSDGLLLASFRNLVKKNYEKTAEFWPWIGLRRNLTSGNFDFKWSDGRFSDQNRYWENGSPPNGEDDDCVVFEVEAGRAIIHNINCGLRQPFICRKSNTSMDPITPPTPVEQPYQSCSDKGTRIGTHCYQLKLDPLSWKDARAACAQQYNYSDGDLASIPKYGAQALMATLLKLAPAQNVWIGLTSEVAIKDVPFQYHWIDGITLRFNNWGSGQPSRPLTEPYCVKMLTDPDAPGKWYDEKCDEKFPYICRYNMDVKATAASPIEPCPDVRFVGSPPSCFRLDETPQTFSKAMKQCTNVNGILAPVIDGYEDALIELLMYYQDVESAWIGMRTNKINGRYELTDNQWPKNYIGWGEQQPSLEVGCVASTFSKGWKSFDCNSARPFICRSNQDVPPTSKPVDPAFVCPQNWYQKEGQCYHFNTGFAANNLMNAFFECSSIGSLPPSIHSRITNNFLRDNARNNVTGQYIWLGLYLEDGKYKWMDGTHIDFTNWEDGEDPTLNDGKRCVVMTLDRDGKWDRVHCTQQAEIVCMIVDLSYHTTLPPDVVTRVSLPVYNTSGLSTGAIVGIGVGGGLLLILIIGCVCFVCEKHFDNREECEKIQHAKLHVDRSKEGGIENPYMMEMARKGSYTSESEQTDSCVSDESGSHVYEDVHF